MSWGAASLALMGLLFISLSGVGWTATAEARAPGCRVLPAAGQDEGSHLLFELDGALFRLTGCEGRLEEAAAADRTPASTGPRRTEASKGVPEALPAVRLSAPTESGSLLYYLPEEDGYLTVHPATD